MQQTAVIVLSCKTGSVSHCFFLQHWCLRSLFHSNSVVGCFSLMSLVLFLQNLCHWLSFLQCSWPLLLRKCCCWLFFATLLFWSASSGHALTLPLCGNPTNSKAAALSESHAIEVFSFPELQRPTTQQTPTTQLLCPNLTPSKVLSKVSLSSLLWPTLIEPS